MTIALAPKGAPTPKPRQAKHQHLVVDGLQFRAASTEEQASGFCGMMQGTALPYGVRDAYGTVFAPGCLDKTRAGRVSTRKVKLFLDHSYGVRTHVGTILELNDVAEAAVMVAGIFDTKEGREAKEYLEAVLNSRSETGLSVGFYDRKSDMADLDGERVLVYREIELEEVSVTPRQAVPGATVTGVRMEPAELEVAERVFRVIAESLPADRATAILAEVHLARGATPPALAPAAPSGDEPTDTTHASTEDSSQDEATRAAANVPAVERVQMLRSALSTT